MECLGLLPRAGSIKYQDSTGGSHSHDWEIDPSLYEGLRTFGNRSMNDLADAVEKISDGGVTESRGATESQ